MSDSKKRERKLAQIRALLARTVSNGCTEVEARTAASAVDRLMATYEIDLDEVTVKKQEIVQRRVPTNPNKAPRHAVDNSAQRIAAFCDCKVWNYVDGLVYFGFQVDTEITEYLTLLFKRAIDREASDFGLFNPDYNSLSPGGKSDMIHSFKVGMATRLGERLDELKSKRDFTRRAAGTDLVAIKWPLIEDAFLSLGLRLGRGSSGRAVRDTGAYQAGQSAANKVQINQGIAGRGQVGGRLK